MRAYAHTRVPVRAHTHAQKETSKQQFLFCFFNQKKRILLARLAFKFQI